MQIKRLDPRAIIPVRANEGDAGFDLAALDAVSIAPQQRAKVRTGLAIALPSGHAGLVLPRSGLALKHGIALVNAPGLIDEGYRGELQVLLLNTDAEETFEVLPGMRIAQLVVIAVATPALEEVAELGDSTRGHAGFGSSGH
ncbi:MAG TPA: dUTP diphosphatase [Baekduia sp.]|nr:dUTP diphosphatase [Baekduia sp.]